MPFDLDSGDAEFVREHRVARMATVDERAQPMVVPICYVFDGEHFYTPIDEKPKTVTPGELKRVRNIRANPKVAIVIDRYSEDWSELAYVLITGEADILYPRPGSPEHRRAVELLREKYQQYRFMSIEELPLIRISPTNSKSWSGGRT